MFQSNLTQLSLLTHWAKNMNLNVKEISNLCVVSLWASSTLLKFDALCCFYIQMCLHSALAVAAEAKGCFMHERQVSVHSVLRQKWHKKDKNVLSESNSLAPVKTCDVADIVLICLIFCLVGWTKCSVVVMEMETVLYLLWPGGGNSRPAMDGFEEQLENEVRKSPHLYDGGTLKTPKRSNSWGEILLLSTPVYQTDHNLFFLRLLLLLCSKIEFKMFSSSAKSNVSQYLVIFSWTASSSCSSTKPHGEAMMVSDTLFKHKCICVVRHVS